MASRIRIVSIICLILLLSFGRGNAVVLESKRECAVCHLAWMDDFNKKNVKIFVDRKIKSNVIIKDGRLGVVSTEEICYTCHDGAVLDSRDKTWFPNSHPVYIIPSKRIRVPKAFPLDKDGRIYCGTCHTAHGVDWGKQKEDDVFQRVVFLRYENQDSFFCRQCHVAKTKMGPNHPINKTTIKIPQEIYDLGGKTGLMANQVICESCHKIHGAKSGYKLLIKGVDRAQLCGICHKDKYVRANRKVVDTFEQAAKLGTHPINIKPITAKISKEILKAGAVLGTGGTVMCLSCHKLHDADSKEKLLVKDNKGSELCYHCHPDKKNGILGTKHDLRLNRPNSKNANGQTPKESGPCGVCHLPHRGNAAKMWARKPSRDKDAIAKLCKSCHSKGRIAESKTLGKFTHTIGESIKNVDGETNLPLYNTKTGARTRKKDEGAVNCGSCHDPHKWQANSNRKPENVNEEGTQANSFLRVQNNEESTLCYECHIDKSLINKSDHDMLMMAEKHPRTHCIQMLGFNEREELIQLPKGVIHKLLGKRDGPTGSCGTCHVPHNAEYYRLWSRDIGVTGQDIGQNLCYTCHEINRLAEVKQPGPFMHPTGVSILNLGIEPKTKLPTYDKQLKKVKGGIVYCFSCHNLHQWNPRKNVKGPGVKSEGTPANSFLRISASDDKWAICYSCHYAKRMIAGTDHELKITVPTAKNYRGQSPTESGICGVCHTVHNAITQARIWIRPLGPGSETMEHLCKSCHAKGRAGQRKTLGDHSHPLGRSILATKPDGNIPWPTFNEKLQYQKNGYATCGSCHNPHLWNPNKFVPGPGKNTEGDFDNSFLRRSNDNGYKFCIVCHVDKDLIVGTDHDMAVTKPTATNWAGETMAAKGPCWQCHRVHNALADIKIWARPFGPGNDGIEIRCKSCHSMGNPGETKLIGPISHPLFANINRADGKSIFPLFDKEGNIDNENGRVVCASCHNLHQWDPGKRKRGPGVKTEGDQYNSFLRRRNMPEPNFCMECHAEKVLVVGTDHDFRFRKDLKDWPNALGRTPMQDGVCSECHQIHNSVNLPRIFSRKLGPSKINMMNLRMNGEVGDKAVRFCLACHSKGQPAEAKMPQVGMHPWNIFVGVKSAAPSQADYVKEPFTYIWKSLNLRMDNQEITDAGRRPGFHMYGNDGIEKDDGDLTCPTCHNPHRWRGDTFTTGPGKNVEGRATDSFLRPQLLYYFCTDCHSYDALYRMKFFHSPRARIKLNPLTVFEELILQKTREKERKKRKRRRKRR